MPRNEATKNRLAARTVTNRIRKDEVSTSFLELKRQREEANKMTITSELKESAESPEAHASQEEQKLPVKQKAPVKGNRQLKSEEDDDWGNPAAAPVRSISKIPKPVAAPPLRRERRSMVMIATRAAPKSLVKPEPKVDQKRVLPHFGNVPKINFKIPKRASKGPEESRPDWATDWKQATGAQNWGTASTVAPTPAPVAEENQFSGPPAESVNSYSALLSKPVSKPRIPPNLGYKPSWALDKKDDMTDAPGDTGCGWVSEKKEDDQPAAGDDGWNDEPDAGQGDVKSNGSVNPAAAAIPTGISVWTNEPVAAAAAPVADDDGWN